MPQFALSLVFSVVVPTCNRLDLLARALERLTPGQQTFDATRYEVIVTDDAQKESAEATLAARYPNVIWVTGPRKGPAANRNNGARFARGEWLVFVDDDCIPDKELLSSYASAIVERASFKVFEGRIYPDRPRRSLAEACPTNVAGGWLWSCNFAITKSLFESMGGFNEQFPYACMEDVDFRERLLAIRESFYFVEAAAVCHPWRPRKIAQELRQHEESVAVYLSLHPEKRAGMGARYYLRLAFLPLLRHVLPALWRLDGAGLNCALREHFGYLCLALKRLSSPVVLRSTQPGVAI
ncbi:MAG: glycosyltransferase family A protein [Chthoniobacteraceae bacterium]